MERRPGGLALVAAALAVVGGIAAVVGSLLAWAEASVGPSSFAAKGIDGWEGKVTIVGGAVLLVGGAAAFLGSDAARGRLRSSALVGGLAAAGVGMYTALTAQDQIVDAAAAEIAKEVGVAIDQARATVELAFDEGVIHLSLQVGLYLVIVGGALGLVAGVIAITSHRAAPAMPAGEPVGLRGWDAAPGSGGVAVSVAPTAAAPVAPEPITPSAGLSSRWGSDAPMPPSRRPEPSIFVAPPPTQPGDATLISSVWAVPNPAPPSDGSAAERQEDEDGDRAETPPDATSGPA